MLSEQEKRSFIESTMKPMADDTMRFLTQVAGVIDERTGEFRGTGFFCSISGRQAIVTAAQVLREMAEDDRYQGPAFSRGNGAPPAIVPGKIVSSIPHDLAIYIPSEDFLVGEQKTFWPEERIDRSPEMLTKDALFVHGFPGRFTRFTTLGGDAMFSESLAYTAMMRYQEKDIPSDERPGFDRDLPGYDFLPAAFLEPHQFAVNFWAEPDFFPRNGVDSGPREGRKVDDWSKVFESGETLPGQRPRGAFGLSGSPIWRIGAAGRSIKDWSPACAQLVGIVTHWNEQERILIATRATSLLELASAEPTATMKA
jgi:hypothetical protein